MPQGVVGVKNMYECVLHAVVMSEMASGSLEHAFDAEHVGICDGCASEISPRCLTGVSRIGFESAFCRLFRFVFHVSPHALISLKREQGSVDETVE